ncbi:hypothetical protein [Paenibacillus sp. B-A-8]|uniref:hypothetical protein n=1 Tax=Paenibacillus sp. B-A-8 TaxID=3400419 RepID=UPI003B01EEFE
MSNVVEELIKSDADIERDIGEGFTSDLLREAQKLVNKDGKKEPTKTGNKAIKRTRAPIPKGIIFCDESIIATVERQFDGEQTLQVILSTWLKSHFKGDKE